MRPNRRFWFVVSCALTALACSSEPRPVSEPAPAAPEFTVAPPVDPTAAQAPGAEIEPTKEQLPVREDFDEEAEQEITAENFRAELDRLERELGETL